MMSREPPVLYVVDADARVLFASDGSSGVSARVAGTLRAAVRVGTMGASATPLLHEGRLVRVESLAAADACACYAVFLEHLAVDRGGAERIEAPHPKRGA